ncbi:FAD binding domain containing protein [Penicillium riverlandense]|uniref:FAD binding domain containing protein n=1 Tax=Penicillium riverlandense TaxID=1903569 RepID=UPI0025488EB5|nr:FAD binding domain containing protein [Penicillium riverlandense]KAJ5832495.1 FAD binding domain containing protein [Penicillium riverlandense]
MPSDQLHVAIIGAGLGGLAAAIGISRTGHKVTILEQAEELGEVGAGIQIPPSSSRVLDEWGLLEKVRSVATLPHDFHLRSRGGRILSTQNIRPSLEERYGYPYFQVHRAGYHRILTNEAIRLGVDLKLQASVLDIDFKKPSVMVKGDPDYEFTADLIIGADGLRSRCRESLLGRADPPRLTGDLAYRSMVKVSDMQSPRLKDLVKKPCTNYWMGPNLHAMCYFIENDQICNIVLIIPDDLPEGVNVASADVEEMRESFRGFDPTLVELLEHVDNTLKWRLQDSVKMERWSHPDYKFVLLGDACHATLPYLAQGAAQAIEDGAVIGALFSKLPRSNFRRLVPDILKIYEHLRKERTAKVVQKSADFRVVFHMEDGPGQEERDRILLHEQPGKDFPFLFADPELQEFLFGYDVMKEVDHAWGRYQGPTVSCSL